MVPTACFSIRYYMIHLPVYKLQICTHSCSCENSEHPNLIVFSYLLPSPLPSPPLPSPPQDLHKGVEIQAANGKKMLALKVFAHALRFFKNHCLQELSDQSSTRIVNDDIRWVITVPAIWRQPAKQFMRHAAYEVCSD